MGKLNPKHKRVQSTIEFLVREFEQTIFYRKLDEETRLFVRTLILKFSVIMHEIYHQSPSTWATAEVEGCIENQFVIWIALRDSPMNLEKITSSLEYLKAFFAFLLRQNLIPNAKKIFELLITKNYSSSVKIERIDKKISKKPLYSDLSADPDLDPSHSLFQLKIVLQNERPPVWRRIEIGADSTFQALHNKIQESFGWSGLHLHDFTFRNPAQFNTVQHIDGLPPSDDSDEIDLEGDYREDQVRLHEIFSLGLKHLKYTYDFGDNWEHKISLEGVLPRDPTASYPRVVKSKGQIPEEF